MAFSGFVHESTLHPRTSIGEVTSRSTIATLAPIGSTVASRLAFGDGGTPAMTEQSRHRGLPGGLHYIIASTAVNSATAVDPVPDQRPRRRPGADGRDAALRIRRSRGRGVMQITSILALNSHRRVSRNYDGSGIGVHRVAGGQFYVRGPGRRPRAVRSVIPAKHTARLAPGRRTPPGCSTS